MDFDFITYRKGRFRHTSEKRFILRKAKLEITDGHVYVVV